MEQFMKFYFNFGKPYLKTTDQVLLCAIVDWSQSPYAYKNEQGFFQCSNPLLKPKYVTFADKTIADCFERLQKYGYIEYYMNDEDYAKSQYGQATRWCRVTDKCAAIIADNSTDISTDISTTKDTTKEIYSNHISYNHKSDNHNSNYIYGEVNTSPITKTKQTNIPDDSSSRVYSRQDNIIMAPARAVRTY